MTWQPVISPHQGDTWSALQSAGGVDLVCVTTRGYSNVRKKQGWVAVHGSEYRELTLPNHFRLIAGIALLWRHRRVAHVFCSPFEDVRQIGILLVAAAIGCRFYLIAEPFNPTQDPFHAEERRWIDGVKHLLRPMLYRLYGSLLARCCMGLFAISSLAATQYRKIGFAPNRISPFGYFVEGTFLGRDALQGDGDEESRAGAIAFFGGTQRRKGLRVLLAAMSDVGTSERLLRLHVYGPGVSPEMQAGQEGVAYRGAIPFGEVPRRIKGYAAVVVPSTFDGWGVIVNEAIAAGVPVICSDAVGAHSVVAKYQCGVVYKSGDVPSLANALRRISSDIEWRMGLADNTQAAAEALKPAVAARVLADVIKSGATVESNSPWY